MRERLWCFVLCTWVVAPSSNPHSINSTLGVGVADGAACTIVVMDIRFSATNYS
jgi:hypothetical protein